jgi:hypothetical protein
MASKADAGNLGGRKIASGWCLLLAGLLLAPIGNAQAASAGLKPSEAPLVTVGQHYFGDASHADNAGDSVDLWRLPPLLTADAITLAWNGAREFEPGLCLAQDVDDYNWAEENNICNGSGAYEVSSSGSARSVISVRSATSAPYLEFWSKYDDVDSPYDFTIESIQHAIGVGLTPVTSIRPTSTLTGLANLSNGSPVPDGLAFTLSASWVTPVNKVSHHRIYTATSGGGALGFSLNLPSSAEGKHVSLTVTRLADPQYLAASSPAIEAKVAKLTLPHKHHRYRHHRHHHRRRHHRHRHHASASTSTAASASGTRQECVPRLLQPPHVIRGPVMLDPKKTEVLIAASFIGVKGCDSWQRLGKFRVQIKQQGRWLNLNGNFWYPTEGRDVPDKNEAHKFGFLDFATDNVHEQCMNGHWEPARVRFINFVKSVKTGKVVAHGNIKNHPVKIKGGGC